MKYLQKYKLFEDMDSSLQEKLDDIILHNAQDTLDFYITNGEINVNDIVDDGANVLQYIISNYDDEFEFDLSTLIEYTNDINYQDDDGYSAFMISVYYEVMGYVKQMLKNNNDINLNIKNNDNEDFTDFDVTIKNDVVDYIIKEYPDKWKDYLMKKDLDKFNI